MENQQLMEELLETQRKTLFYARMACVFTGAFLAVLVSVAVILLPEVTRTMNRAQSSLNEIDSMVSSLNAAAGEHSTSLSDVISQLGELDIGRFNETLAKLDSVDLSRLDNVMDVLETVDFERINSAIQQLDGILEPLSRLASVLR